MAEPLAGPSCAALLGLGQPEASPERADACADARALLLVAALLRGQAVVGSHAADLGIRTLKEVLPEDCGGNQCM